MSHKGQVLRGEKWYSLYRDADGKLLPAVADDPHKLKDINAYLEEKKKAEEKPKETKSKKEK